jgi:hypothetical protein
LPLRIEGAFLCLQFELCGIVLDIMKSHGVVLILAGLLVTTSAFADLKTDWQKKMDMYCAAQKRKDVKGATAIIKENFAPEFKFIPLKGKAIGLSEWLAQGKMEIEMSETVKAMSITISDVKMGKDSAMMKTVVAFEGTVKMDPKAKAGVMKVSSTAEQKMVKKGGKWWIAEIRQIAEKATYNGKPMAGV